MAAVPGETGAGDMPLPAARTYALTSIGDKVQLVTIEAVITDGLPETVIIGLPSSSLREARDRIRAAVINSGEDWPAQKVSIRLEPAKLGSASGCLDLAIAIAVVAAARDLPREASSFPSKTPRQPLKSSARPWRQA